jgi:hypothetical protein
VVGAFLGISPLLLAPLWGLPLLCELARAHTLLGYFNILFIHNSIFLQFLLSLYVFYYYQDMFSTKSSRNQADSKEFLARASQLFQNWIMMAGL